MTPHKTPACSPARRQWPVLVRRHHHPEVTLPRSRRWTSSGSRRPRPFSQASGLAIPMPQSRSPLTTSRLPACMLRPCLRRGAPRRSTRALVQVTNQGLSPRRCSPARALSRRPSLCSRTQALGRIRDSNSITSMVAGRIMRCLL